MEETFKVGDLVQIFVHPSKDGNAPYYKDGKITLVSSPKENKPKDWWLLPEEKRKEYQQYYTVKFDYDDTEQVLEDWLVAPRDSELEREFRNAADAAHNLINVKLQEASKLLDEAVKISEECGVPFHTEISYVGNAYLPESAKKKFPNLDFESMKDISGSDHEYDSPGWENSSRVGSC